MTERKWTPGPWEADGCFIDANRCMEQVCNTLSSVNGRNFADARLIAAAPDLYEALESAEESIATFMGVHGYPMDSGAGDILRQVSAALAKARGET